MLPYILTDTSLTVVIEGKPNVIADTHPNFSKICEKIKASAWDDIPDLIDIPAAIKRFVQGELEVWDNEVRFQGEPLSNAATERLLAMMAQGFNVSPLVNFLTRVVNNPDPRAVNGLYQWLERGNLPITQDGYIIAYKLVRDDYLDHYSGRLDHSVGKVVTLPRFKCDPDPDRTCSSGLHFCSAAYLPHYGSSDSRVVLVKIDPADVVAFPHDYNISKGRCCRYEVVQEIDRATAASFFGNVAVFNTDGTPTANTSGYTLSDWDDGYISILDEDEDVAFSIDVRGIYDVADFMTINDADDAPFILGEVEDFDTSKFEIRGLRLYYGDVAILEFSKDHNGYGVTLISGLDAAEVPFPTSADSATIRVR